MDGEACSPNKNTRTKTSVRVNLKLLSRIEAGALKIYAGGLTQGGTEMSKTVFVLEVCWTWDHFNTDFLTLTYEEGESKTVQTLEGLWMLPEANQERKRCADKLVDLAQRQTCSPGSLDLVRLWRVVKLIPGTGPLTGHHSSLPKNKKGERILSIAMTPICDFRNNQPVRPDLEL